MEKRTPSRVSEAQWGILMEFLESNPNLARARGYNNSARGRAESLRLWQEVASLLNAEGSGTTKSPKEWSVYVSNYKSKLKKIVADTNADANATGGGPPRANQNLTDWERRFLALLGPGFGQTAPRVMVQPIHDEQPPITAGAAESQMVSESQMVLLEVEDNIQSQEEVVIEEPTEATPQHSEDGSMRAPTPAPTTVPASSQQLLPQRRRQRRIRTRPLAPLDEARRILSQVEMQRAISDARNAQAHELLAHNIMPVADIAQNLGRLAAVAERYLEYLMTPRTSDE